MRGIGEDRLARLRAPAGPDAGAKTPGEIALLAIVGVLAILRGKSEEAAAAQDVPVSVAPPLTSPSANAADASGRFVNPVCGRAIETVSPKHVERFDGIDYYFCCDCCWNVFREAPEKFAAIHRAAIGQVRA
jgi:xanthine dehydrogenase accessory factor